MTDFVHLSISAALLVMIGLLVPCIYRLWQGPTSADRVQVIDTVTTLLIGIMLNGMTMLNLTYTAQNVIKALILLFALVLDTLINPRDEQTAQQGDI